MGYIIEVSIDTRNKSNARLLLIKEQIENAAYSNDCIDYYTQRETEGYNKTISRNSIVITVEFERELINKCVSFIQIVKKNKGTHLECVYQNHSKIKILYASSHYIKQMETSCAEDFKKFQTKILLNEYEQDNILMKELYKIR